MASYLLPTVAPRTLAACVLAPALVAAHATVSENATIPPFLAAMLPASMLDASDTRSVLAVCASTLAFLPLFLSVLLPSNLPSKVEKVMVAFAAGSLLGDVFLHLLPHLLGEDHGHGHGHDHDHDHKHGHDHHDHHHHHHASAELPASMKMLIGFVAFLLMEKVMSVLMSGDAHSHGDESILAKLDATDDAADKHKHDDGATTATKSATGELRRRKTQQGKEEKSATEVKTSKKAASAPAMKPAAYLHLLASSIHVFTDGLLLTLSFAHSLATGLSTFLALVLHEVPHRLGDFTIMQTILGCNRGQAINAQVVLSLATFSGSLAGYSLPKTLIDVIMPYVGGGLVYVATVGVIPELVGHGHSHSHGEPVAAEQSHHHHDHDDHGHGHGHSHGRTSAIVELVLEMGALGAGIAVMAAVA